MNKTIKARVGTLIMLIMLILSLAFLSYFSREVYG